MKKRNYPPELIARARELRMEGLPWDQVAKSLWREGMRTSSGRVHNGGHLCGAMIRLYPELKDINARRGRSKYGCSLIP